MAKKSKPPKRQNPNAQALHSPIFHSKVKPSKNNAQDDDSCPSCGDDYYHCTCYLYDLEEGLDDG